MIGGGNEPACQVLPINLEIGDSIKESLNLHFYSSGQLQLVQMPVSFVEPNIATIYSSPPKLMVGCCGGDVG